MNKIREERMEQFRVGIVDDSGPTLRMSGMLLKSRLGCEVSLHEHGETLLEEAKQSPCDLYLIDLVLPDIPGFEVGKILRKREVTKDIPIIYFSAKGDKRTRVQALQCGGIDYLDKPFYPEELIARVRNHLSLHNSKQLIDAQMREQQGLLKLVCNDLLDTLTNINALIGMRKLPGHNLSEEALDLIADSTHAGLVIIKNISDYRSILSDEVARTIQHVDIAEAIRETLEKLRRKAQKKEISFELDLTDGAILRLNRALFNQQVLYGLIDNAIKFSEPQSKIEISNVTHENKHEILIRDFGIGIPEKMLEVIFDPTVQTSREGTQKESSDQHAGLPLIKLCILKAGGTIEITSKERGESNADSGTTIRLTYPL